MRVLYISQYYFKYGNTLRDISELRHGIDTLENHLSDLMKVNIIIPYLRIQAQDYCPGWIEDMILYLNILLDLLIYK